MNNAIAERIRSLEAAEAEQRREFVRLEEKLEELQAEAGGLNQRQIELEQLSVLIVAGEVKGNAAKTRDELRDVRERREIADAALGRVDASGREAEKKLRRTQVAKSEAMLALIESSIDTVRLSALRGLEDFLNAMRVLHGLEEEAQAVYREESGHLSLLLVLEGHRDPENGDFRRPPNWERTEHAKAFAPSDLISLEEHARAVVVDLSTKTHARTEEIRELEAQVAAFETKLREA